MEIDWLRFLHLIGLIVWMATLFILPRLFVDHARYRDNSTKCNLLKLQEKSFFVVGFLSMIITLASGVGLIVVMGGGEYMKASAWLHIKLTLVIVFVIYHLACGFFLKQLDGEVCPKSERFFRIFAMIPKILLVATIYLAIFQPSLWVK